MNKFQFMGRLTKEPEARNTANSKAVATFSIAVNRKFSNATTGEKQTDFFNCTAFGKTAEFISKYFKKGQQVLVEGRIQNRSWEDTTGAKRYATDFIVENTYFADSKNMSENGANSQDNTEDKQEYVTIDNTDLLPF
jgi:single-strand DNA-binding protein